jgi:hypothetical protein
MDREVELRVIDDAGLESLRRLRDEARQRGTVDDQGHPMLVLKDEERERLRQLRGEVAGSEELRRDME